MFVDYEQTLYHYIKLITSGQLPFKKYVSSKDLPVITLIESHHREMCYQLAFSIIKSNLKFTTNSTFKRYQKIYRYFSNKQRQTNFLSKRYRELHVDLLKRVKIDIKSVKIPFGYKIFNIRTGNHFDYFIRITTPYRKSETRYHTINIPINEHKHSLQYTNWKRKSYIELFKINGNIYLKFVYEKEVSTKTSGESIAFDCGYKKLLSDSNGVHYGKELFSLYNKLSKMKRGSKNYKQIVIHKNNEINRIINSVPLENIKTVIVEALKNVKKNSKLSSKTMNKMQYWCYSQVMRKLEARSQEEGFNLINVNPAYTSQTCGSCSTIDKSNRQGEVYQCKTCGLLIDADSNAAINILHKGTGVPLTIKDN